MISIKCLYATSPLLAHMLSNWSIFNDHHTPLNEPINSENTAKYSSEQDINEPYLGNRLSVPLKWGKDLVLGPIKARLIA